MLRLTLIRSNDDLHSLLKSLVRDITESELRTVHTLSGQEQHAASETPHTSTAEQRGNSGTKLRRFSDGGLQLVSTSQTRINGSLNIRVLIKHQTLLHEK